MKRLVICFDGTWKRAQDTNVSNIEKIARIVRNDAEGVQQTVYYLGGVGASYKVDRVLGGAIGLGLGNNLMSAYRFLALNYVAGDQVYVFGFSRGAFTARSLVGMIDRVGLVRADGLIKGSLKTAERRYQQILDQETDQADTAAEFKHDFCHKHVCIPFLGVFDTVEALGPKAKFHRIDFLHRAVAVGRQALAIDERRRVFRPRLWTGDAALARSGRVRQAWFEGFHSDIGGGVPETGLSDTTLLWMVAEATRQGLAFDEDTLVDYVTSGSEAKRHDSMKPGYRLTNLLLRPLARSRVAFSRGWRILAPEESLGVRISSSALAHFREGTYERPGVKRWLDAQPGGSPPTEDVVAFPELDDSVVREIMRRVGAEAAAAGGAVHACPAEGHGAAQP